MLRSGDVIRVDFGMPRGSGPGFERPSIVVTADEMLEYQPRTLHVVPLTTNTHRRLASEVSLEPVHGAQPSVAQCHLLQVISVEQIVDDQTGRVAVGRTELAQIRSIIGDLLDIG